MFSSSSSTCRITSSGSFTPTSREFSMMLYNFSSLVITAFQKLKVFIIKRKGNENFSTTAQILKKLTLWRNTQKDTQKDTQNNMPSSAVHNPYSEAGAEYCSMALCILRFISRTTELGDNLRTPGPKPSIREKNSQFGSTTTEKIMLPSSALSRTMCCGEWIGFVAI